MRRRILIVLFSLISGIGTSLGEPSPPTSLNRLVVDIIDSMPVDGGYSVSTQASRVLSESIRPASAGLEIDPAHAVPSYCSGATYLVVASVCQRLIAEGKLALPNSVLRAMLVSGQRDGEGIWGRWNANGPGTARLFHELDLGPNFTDWDQARPGDFMKIFWTNEIGVKERGHSVVYLGVEAEGGVEYVHFWSSNKPRGYGKKRVTRRSVAYAIFSRLEYPQNFANFSRIPLRDVFLGSMLTKRSSPAEVREKCGM